MTIQPTPKAVASRLAHCERTSACLARHRAVAYLFLVRLSRPPDEQRITACQEKGLMNIAGLRSIGAAVLLVLLAGAGCNRPKRASSESSAAPTPQGVHASITAHAPDAFYDPPSDVSRQPGALLRSGPLKDVILPAGMRGWRILYATTVDDSTPATAVATVFAPTDPPAGPRPVITWEHGTTGLLQKCMPSLLSAPTADIPGRDRIVMAGWVVVATDYSFAEKGGPHPYLIGEGEARAALDSVRAAADVRAYARQTHGSVGLLAGGARSALDRHCRATLRARPRNPRRRCNCTGRKH